MDFPKSFSLATGETLIIEKAYPEDAKALIEYLNKVGGETDYLTFGHNEFFLSLDEEIEVIKDCLKGYRLMLVGKIDNEITSQLFLDRSEKPRLSHVVDLGIFVRKKRWGNGIGRKMVESAIAWAKLEGITKINLQVRTDNLSAIKIYEKLGFTIEGETTRASKIGGVYFNDYIMGLSL